MPLSDLPLADLQRYTYPRAASADLREFWDDTLAGSRAATTDVSLVPADTAVTAFEISDVTFAGFDGEPIRAWWTRPRGATGELPVVIEYIGYGGGRGLPHERMLWAANGYHHFVVDSRGQGSMLMTGDTADPHGSGPASNGYLTRGVDAPENLYYRRLLTNAALAVDAVRTLPGVCTDRVAVWGHSQGGALALEAAARLQRARGRRRVRRGRRRRLARRAAARLEAVHGDGNLASAAELNVLTGPLPDRGADAYLPLVTRAINRQLGRRRVREIGELPTDRPGALRPADSCQVTAATPRPRRSTSWALRRVEDRRCTCLRVVLECRQ